MNLEERQSVYQTLGSVTQFTQLLADQEGKHQLPSSAHPHLHTIWQAGLAELLKFPKIVEKLQRKIITWKLAEKTCLDAVIRVLIRKLPSHTAVLHTIVVNPRQAPDHARKLNSYLQNEDSAPRAYVVACSALFDNTYPALCRDNIWVCERRATHLKQLTAQIHAFTSGQGTSAVHILQHDEADDGQGMHESTQYVQALATLSGSPQGEWRTPGTAPPQLLHPLRLLTTATPLPCIMELHAQEPPVTLKSEDVIWMDPSPEYGGVADMYRTLRHPVLGTPCCILPRSPCAANHYLLFDEGKLWLDDLVRTPCGYGLALNTDKVIKEGGISEGPAAARDAYREHNLSVLGVSGGNRMWLALHGREDTILIQKGLRKPAIYGPADEIRDSRSEWTALACHIEAILNLIGRKPFLVIGMTSLLRGITLSVFGPKLPADHLYYPDSTDPDKSRPVSHILQNVGPGRAFEDATQGRGRATGYHARLLQQVTGRNYVTELTTPQDGLGGDRWFTWKDMFRARLEAGSDSQEAIATVTAESAFVDAMRAGRSSGARKIGKRKWDFAPTCDESDPEVELLSKRAKGQRKRLPKYMHVLKAVWQVDQDSQSESVDIGQIDEQLEKDGHKWQVTNANSRECVKRGWLQVNREGRWTLTLSGQDECRKLWTHTAAAAALVDDEALPAPAVKLEEDIDIIDDDFPLCVSHL